MPARPAKEEGQYSDLSVRFATAVFLGIVAAFVMWRNGILLGVFAAAMAAMMVGELMAIVQKDRDASRLVRLCLVVGAAYVGLAAALSPIVAVVIAVLLLTMAYFVDRDVLGREVSLGYLVICAAAISVSYLRDMPHGFALSLWIVGSVVANDTGGYFAGRALGGPKLWPSVSPKKTISGFAGGLGFAALFSLGFAIVVEGNPVICVILGVILAAVASGGDLTESALKRRHGVKDAGQRLPGHGGLLDRFDGLIAVLPFALVIHLLLDLRVLVGLTGEI